MCLGSPPQVRGKQGTDIPLIETLRITPAGAGKTALMPNGGAVKWDHPRRCGENKRCLSPCENGGGSPPQVRGKLGMAGFGIDTSRITPAGAGKTPKQILHNVQRQDHPRRCGENPVLHDFRAVGTGSPPQVRGKLYVRFFNRGGNRITPAGAGKTAAFINITGYKKDHPRRCGENVHMYRD